MDDYINGGEEPSALLSFFYDTALGRLLLHGLTCPAVSALCGRYLDSPVSQLHIASFARKNHINLNDYESRDYKSFNDFFTRRIRDGLRPVDPADDSLIAPCDGRLSLYRITKNASFSVKGSRYSVADFLGGSSAAAHYANGLCLIFRLCVGDYHRYCYVDSGVPEDSVFIPGILHTVRPIALRRYPVFIQNSRAYTILHTEHFGTVAQIEVGALLVGRIQNHPQSGPVRKGEEKGMFLYGGSTVVVLLEDGVARLPEPYFERTRRGEEVLVKYGQKIGTAGR
ncbi:MAG: phosphatidylserine decarboxylase [Intestinimonas sp.]|jgi:phosphatidylserine decarboxylase|nr:phosphatidylserine decarboxylase [Intestinimonas sp.]